MPRSCSAATQAACIRLTRSAGVSLRFAIRRLRSMPKSRAAAIRLPGTGWRSLSIFLSSRSTSLFYPSGAGRRRGVVETVVDVRPNGGRSPRLLIRWFWQPRTGLAWGGQGIRRRKSPGSEVPAVAPPGPGPLGSRVGWRDTPVPGGQAVTGAFEESQLWCLECGFGGCQHGLDSCHAEMISFLVPGVRGRVRLAALEFSFYSAVY